MLRIITRVPLFFFSIIGIFLVGKIVFMAYYHDLFSVFSLRNYLQVLVNGLLHDASIAGYLTAIPTLYLIAATWTQHRAVRFFIKGYLWGISALMAIILVVDIILYEYWGFRLDASPLFYLLSPQEALASTSWWLNIGGILSAIVLALVIFQINNRLLVPVSSSGLGLNKRIMASGILLVELALLFIPVRGGFKESTMNVGKVYFSNEILLNHAAVNPAFSLFESLSTLQQFDKQYRFLPDDEATAIFDGLTQSAASDSIPQLFTLEKPNVVFVILESFMSLNLTSLGGMPGVAVHLDSLAREGILFTNMYANSFRTDRALVSLLSAFPAQPTTSLMKYPRKLQKLPTFPGELKKAGYHLQYLYGGDADFTSMRSYLKVCGFENIIEDVSFPRSYNTTKWGVPDQHVFNALRSEIENQHEFPFLKVIQTQSSHHPFDVPYKSRHTDPYLNSVAYTDSCLGEFIRQFRQLPAWENTIVVLVPDHAMRYPYDLDNRSVERYKIPLVIAGGAIRNPQRIERYASQTDIAATLLHQFRLDASGFTFSRDILNPSNQHFGFFTFKDGFGMVSSENAYVFDNEAGKVSTNTGLAGFNEKRAQAWIQKLYDVLDAL